jgi:RNA 3'-terminal phosphate cyclase (ATP)
MLTIDGSMGEGGGQILRTSLALSAVTGTAVRVVNIRAGRSKPGLLRQHLTAAQAAARIANAALSGASPGSQTLEFVPQRPAAGHYELDVGTAGSVTLVLQTVLPSLMRADGDSSLGLSGGTHNPFAPPFEFIERVFLPLINRMGPTVKAKLDRPGFYPAGGGKMRVRIQPANLAGLELSERGRLLRCRARALVANLPRHIAERELKVLKRKLAPPPDTLEIEEVKAIGPGNAVLVELECERLTELFVGFGQRGVRAETVAEQTAKQARRYLQANVAAGEYLADQLLLPLALAGRGGFTTLALSGHARTNIEVIGAFLDVSFATEPVGEDAWRVTVSGGKPPP